MQGRARASGTEAAAQDLSLKGPSDQVTMSQQLVLMAVFMDLEREVSAGPAQHKDQMDTDPALAVVPPMPLSTSTTVAVAPVVCDGNTSALKTSRGAGQ